MDAPPAWNAAAEIVQSRHQQEKAEKREALLARWRVKYERPAAEVRAGFPLRPPSPPRAVPFASKKEEEQQAERALDKEAGPQRRAL